MSFKKVFSSLILTSLLISGCNGNEEDVIKIIPSQEQTFNTEDILNQGVINLRAKNIQKSIELLEKFTSYYPNHAIGQFYLGKAYYTNKNYTEAIIKFKKAYNLDKSVTEALLYLGKAYKETGYKKKSIKTFYKYILNEQDSLSINRAREEINKMTEPVIGKDVIGRIFVTDEVLKEKNLALSIKSCFTVETPEVYASLELLEAPSGTKIKAKWNYFLSEEKKMEVNSTSFIAEGSKNALVSLKKPFSGWPEGEYQLEIFTNQEKNASFNFYIF